MSKVLKLSAPWCSPCKQMDSQLARLQMVVEHVDIDVDKNLGKLYAIRSIPTLIKLDDAGIEIGRLIGAQTDAKLLEFLS